MKAINRKMIENHVAGVNKYLASKVKTMSLQELLANSHPQDRQEFLKDEIIKKQLEDEKRSI